MIFTPSEPASASVATHLHVPPERIRTVPHGIEPPVPVPADLVAAVRRRYRLGDRMILYPAITYAHKDHITLIGAFARLARSRPDLTLVLPGAEGPQEHEVVRAIRRSGVGDQIRRTGRIPWDDLRALYGAATVVAVPSRFEGFGAPALEAMVAGIPVVVADATALPWVVGGAGLRAPVGDVAHWADELARVVDSPQVQATLAEAGRVRARAFSWARSSAALADGYRAAAAMGEDGRP
jgi:alpha-1,3-rhamnosyl/mannosyltransferase